MQKQKTPEEEFQDRAEDAVFLVEGWENLGTLEDRRVYRGVVGPWVIVVRVPVAEAGSESSHAVAMAENLKVGKSFTFSPSFARAVLKRATFDEKRRVVLQEKREERKTRKARRKK